MAGITENNIDQDSVPGTVVLVDVDYATGRLHAKNHEDIVLVPTPSSDPDDPLNWTPRRKYLATSCMVVYCMCVGIAASGVNSVIVPLSVATGISVSDLISSSGYLFLFAGWALLFWQPIALQYGKRLTYLLTLLGTLGVTVWTPYVTNNGQWIVKNILGGIFSAVIDSIPEVTVTDLYFTHERGKFMGVYAFALLSSNCIGPIMSGFINDSLGYRWVFYIPAIFCGVGFVFLFLFMEETNYERKTVGVVSMANETVPEKKDSPESSNKQGVIIESVHEPPDMGVMYSKKTYWQKLALLDKPRPFMVFTMAWQQLRFLTWPVVFYSGFAYGSSIIYSIVLSSTSSLILSSAPYHFSAAMVGLSNISPLVGTLLGSLSGGFFSDVLTIYLVRRNKGVFEPEMRLWLMLVSIILLPSSLILWGVGAAHGVHWFGLMVAWCLLQFASCTTIPLSVNYLVDSYKDQSGDAITTVMIIRNTMGFAINYGISPWINNLGLQNTFISCAFLALATTATFVIMIVWGKKFRSDSRTRYWNLVSRSIKNGMVH